MTQSSTVEAITHILLLWAANSRDKPHVHLHICKGPSYTALFQYALTVSLFHEDTTTEQQGQKKAFISTSEQS